MKLCCVTVQTPQSPGSCCWVTGRGQCGDEGPLTAWRLSAGAAKRLHLNSAPPFASPFHPRAKFSPSRNPMCPRSCCVCAFSCAGGLQVPSRQPQVSPPFPTPLFSFPITVLELLCLPPSAQKNERPLSRAGGWVMWLQLRDDKGSDSQCCELSSS